MDAKKAYVKDELGEIFSPFTSASTVNLNDGRSLEQTTLIIESKVETNNNNALNAINTTNVNLTQHIDALELHLSQDQIDAILLLAGATGNIQQQINNLQNVFNETFIKDTYAEMQLITTQFDSDLCIVRFDETRSNTTTMYLYKNNLWEFVTVLSVQVRNFLIDPINIITETTGLFPEQRIDELIARKTYVDNVAKQALSSATPVTLYFTSNTAMSEIKPVTDINIPFSLVGGVTTYHNFSLTSPVNEILTPTARRENLFYLNGLTSGRTYTIVSEMYINSVSVENKIASGISIFVASTSAQNVGVLLNVPYITEIIPVAIGDQIIQRIGILKSGGGTTTVNIFTNVVNGQFSTFTRSGDNNISATQVKDIYNNEELSQSQINEILRSGLEIINNDMGDMTQLIYDPQRKETDIFKYIDDAIAAIPVNTSLKARLEGN